MPAIVNTNKNPDIFSSFFFTNLILAFYNFDKKVYSVNCYETTRFSIDNHSFQNDETLIYMLLNMGLITDITTQYNRNRLIDDVLKIQ